MLQTLVASHHVLASPSSAGWPSRISVTRPNRVHAFALRLTPSSQGAPAARLLRAAAPSTSWRTSTYHVRYLSIEEISQASPGTPKARRQDLTSCLTAGVIPQTPGRRSQCPLSAGDWFHPFLQRMAGKRKPCRNGDCAPATGFTRVRCVTALETSTSQWRLCAGDWFHPLRRT